ncbi:MAG: Lrp/AsnC family transcriptional regulator [Hyphomonadaceae bacterium]|nr:Lrp/AsnC family transcriptional regulator [Hyphomonadaceae bacterium]
MTELDRIDRNLLRLLQKDNQLTNLELAKLANLSPPTCLRRVRRLREEKIIVADVSIVDPARVGQKLFVFVEVTLERQTERMQRAFEQKMTAAAEVMQCYMISGQSDFVIVVLVPGMEEYHSFVRSVLADDPNIRNFRSMFAMNRTKFRIEVDPDAVF